MRAASAATTVLPDPTSPSSRRDIGTRLPRSSRILSNARRWPAVSANGSDAIQRATSSSSARSGSAFASFVHRARRWPSASCSTRSSSNARRRRALKRSFHSDGKWTSRSASWIGTSERRVRTASGSGSATSRTTGVRFAPPITAVCSQRRRWPSFSPSVSRYIGTMRPVCTASAAAFSIFGFENWSDRPKNLTLPESRTSCPSG